ncbi:MAG TPA: hypothetical protein VLD35_12455 [Caldimonas sp.]|nr:hypothetical protein [Caldimonas sp.]
MSAPTNRADPPTASTEQAELDPRATGTSAGNPAPGSDAAGAATERPARAGQTERRSRADAGSTQRSDDDEEDDEWRHEPVAPVDEPNPLRSLGKAVGDTLTGTEPDPPEPSKR